MNKRPDNYEFDNIYSSGYSLTQTKKFLMRRIRVNDICHWHDRIKLFCDEIIERLDLAKDPVFLDLGCNIGTFAIEMASRGRKAVGVDLSQAAVDYANALVSNIGLENKPKFVKGDVSDAGCFPPSSFDVIMAEDIFEHLHDDLLQKTLNNCRLWLKPGGYLVYHTFPSKYEYIFHARGWKATLSLIPLIPFLIHRDRKFKNAVEFYHRRVLNPVSKLLRGRTREEMIVNSAHCNPLTASSLLRGIEAAGLSSMTIKTANLYKLDVGALRNALFGKREYFHKNIYGIAWKPFAGLT